MTARRQWILAAALLLVAGCGELQRADPLAGVVEPAAPAVAALAWPGPPEDPRIAFVSTFATPADLDIDQGVFAKIRRVVFGARAVHLIRPMAITRVREVTFVADPGASGVHRFDANRSTYDLVRAANDTPLPSPVALTSDQGGAVYVADSALGRIFVIDPGSDVARPLDVDVALEQPTGIVADQDTGELFVVDTAAHRVYVLDSGGRRLRDFGVHGDGRGEFNFPTLIGRTPDGEFLVVDALNFRVQRFDRDGNWLSGFGRHGDGTGDMARQKGVATDSEGHVYVVDALFHAVQIFSPDGEFLLSFGNQGQGPGEFWLPTGIFIDADDVIYVADSYNRRVQVFRYLGGTD